ncbi:hypothetical protein GCM10009530_65750 [Microbispora corallina]|uniref:Uncharacterized protein n=1 Tax=Microbispora corallina TaxID=83302 RepID=A0ABQ4G973_9ACTN|nr:hypothetical protein Mco01_65810 [Microbispora corallina]
MRLVSRPPDGAAGHHRGGTEVGVNGADAVTAADQAGGTFWWRGRGMVGDPARLTACLMAAALGMGGGDEGRGTGRSGGRDVEIGRGDVAGGRQGLR